MSEELPTVALVISSDLGEGDQFQFLNIDEDRNEIHEIIGWLIGANSTSTMFTFVVNHPDGLKYVNKWNWISDGLIRNTCRYNLVTASNYTVLDMVAHFDKVKGF